MGLDGEFVKGVGSGGLGKSKSFQGRKVLCNWKGIN